MDEWTNGRTDGRTDGRTGGCMDAWMDDRSDGLVGRENGCRLAGWKMIGWMGLGGWFGWVGE